MVQSPLWRFHHPPIGAGCCHPRLRCSSPQPPSPKNRTFHHPQLQPWPWPLPSPWSPAPAPSTLPPCGVLCSSHRPTKCRDQLVQAPAGWCSHVFGEVGVNKKLSLQPPSADPKSVLALYFFPFGRLVLKCSFLGSSAMETEKDSPDMS